MPKVNTNLFTSTHGKAPKGFGLWFFRFKAADGTPYQTSSTGLFTECKKRALAMAKLFKNVTEVVVLP